MKQYEDYATIIQKRGDILFDHECPKCGWCALTNKGIDEGYCEVIHSQKTNTDFGPGFEMHVKCTCPICNTEFEYFDGSP